MTQFGGAGGSFGPNAWLVDDMYDRFLADPGSVSESWREFFADYRPAPVPAPPPHPRPRPRRPGSRHGDRSAGSRRHQRGGERRGHPAARGGLADRGQHGGQPGRAHGHQRPHGPGPPARGQPAHPQQPAGADDRGKGQLHPHHRLRRGPRPQRRAGAQRGLRGRRRRVGQARRRPPQARRPRARRRPGEERRQPDPARAVHQGRRHTRLPLLRAGLRGPHPQDRAPTRSRPTTSRGRPCR